MKGLIFMDPIMFIFYVYIVGQYVSLGVIFYGLLVLVIRSIFLLMHLVKEKFKGGN